MNPSTVATRQETLLSELKLLEARFGRLSQTVKKWQQTPEASKSKEDEKRPAKKDGKAKQQSIPAPSSSTSSSSSDEVTLPSDDDPSRWWDESTYVVDNAGVVPRLRALCQSYGLTKSRFYRVSGNYYDWTLEQRRDALDPATTIQHLCKSVVMVNTRFQPPETEGNQKYILVIVSYAEKLHKERLANAVYDRYKRLTPEPKSKRAFDANWRLADNDEAIEMTGYQHNGMTPIGMNRDFLIVVSDSILRLSSGSFFLGGGEVDVKWRVSVKQFVEHFKPIIANITTA